MVANSGQSTTQCERNDGCYTRLLRMDTHILLKYKVTNTQLYRGREEWGN